MIVYRCKFAFFQYRSFSRFVHNPVICALCTIGTVEVCEMYINSGYLNNSRLPFKDKSKPLIVGSCGTYRLKTVQRLPTWRPRGRLDYQLLYIVSGKTHFYFKGKERGVTAGHMVLIQPRQEQRYEYFGAEKPEVYWVHFTGGDVKNILRQYEIPMDDPVFYSGASSIYTYIFKEMINELQTCRTGFEELLAMYLRQIFLLVQRTRQEQKPSVNTYMQEEMEYARRYFNEHYNEAINIEEYAQSRSMSVSWFQRNFKQIVNYTPMQYLLTIRVNNAASLLETTDYSMSEIAAIVGYDDALYFSRLFRKLKGMSPSEYRKLIAKKGQTDSSE